MTINGPYIGESHGKKRGMLTCLFRWWPWVAWRPGAGRSLAATPGDFPTSWNSSSTCPQPPGPLGGQGGGEWPEEPLLPGLPQVLRPVHWPTSGHLREETFSLLASGSRPEVEAEVARLREAGEALAPALLVGKSGLLLEVPGCQVARYHYSYLLPGGRMEGRRDHPAAAGGPGSQVPGSLSRELTAREDCMAAGVMLNKSRYQLAVLPPQIKLCSEHLKGFPS